MLHIPLVMHTPDYRMLLDARAFDCPATIFFSFYLYIPTFLRFIPHGDYGYVHPLTSDGYRVATVLGKGRSVISARFRPLPTTALSWSSRESTKAKTL